MKTTRIFFSAICTALVILFIVSAAFPESFLQVEERMAILSDKIETGGIRGALSNSEYTRLKLRLTVLVNKSARLRKTGTTTNQYLDLERELVGLEKDTDRLLNSLKRR